MKSQDIFDHDLNKLDNEQLQYCDILIVTVINDLEETQLHKHLRKFGAVEKTSTDAEVDDMMVRWSLPSSKKKGSTINILTKCLGNAGNGNAGIELLHLLYRNYRPRLVAFCGIGGSLDVDEAQLGNVLVGSSFQWRGYDKITEGETAVEMRKKVIHDHPTKESFVNQLRAFAKDNEKVNSPLTEGLISDYQGQSLRDALVSWKAVSDHDDEDLKNFDHLSYEQNRIPRVKFGRIMSWDFVLNSKSIRKELKEIDSRYIGVDMESGGISRAIKKACDYSGNKIELLVIRGISDLCSKKTDNVFRIIAADHAAAFLVGFLHHRFDLETL